MIQQRLIDLADVVFEKKEGGVYYAIKSRIGYVVPGGKYSEEFIRDFAKYNFNVLIV